MRLFANTNVFLVRGVTQRLTFVKMGLFFLGTISVQSKTINVPSDHSCALHAFLVLVSVFTVRSDLFKCNGFLDALAQYYDGDVSLWKSDALCIYDYIFAKKNPCLDGRFVRESFQYQRAFFAFVRAYESNTWRMHFENIYAPKEQRSADLSCGEKATNQTTLLELDKPWFAKHAQMLMETGMIGSLSEQEWLSGVDVGVFSLVMQEYLGQSFYDIGLDIVPSASISNHFVIDVRCALHATLMEKGGSWSPVPKKKDTGCAVATPIANDEQKTMRVSSVLARAQMMEMLEHDKGFNQAFPLRKYSHTTLSGKRSHTGDKVPLCHNERKGKKRVRIKLRGYNERLSFLSQACQRVIQKERRVLYPVCQAVQEKSNTAHGARISGWHTYGLFSGEYQGVIKHVRIKLHGYPV